MIEIVGVLTTDDRRSLVIHLFKSQNALLKLSKTQTPCAPDAPRYINYPETKDETRQEGLWPLQRAMKCTT